MYLKQKFIFISAILSTSLLINIASAEDKTAVHPGNYTSHAMQKSMDPQAWTKMMSMMMDPGNYSSSMESCAECHDGEDIARYQQQFGPMMDSMFSMYKSMSPEQMMGMMGPMMNMMNPMMGMMNPMMGMMNPMMGMMNPMMMSMMGPMMGMMNPMSMMGGMMNPMSMMGGMGGMGNMMNPMSMMGGMGGMGNMMNPMGMMGGMGGMGNMMNPMGMMGGMNPMGQGGDGTAMKNPMNMMGSTNGLMDPKQYEQWFGQMTEMMNNYAPKSDPKK